MDKQPQAPFTPCTEMAPTGSSIRLLSQKYTDSTTRTPATKPIMQAPMESTNAQGAVMATRPASIPLQIIVGSGFLVLNHHMYRQVAIAPVAEANIVLVATTAM